MAEKTFYFKIRFEFDSGHNCWRYYESTSISALISWLADNGCAVGFIIEIKRIARLPQGVLPYKGYD